MKIPRDLKTQMDPSFPAKRSDFVFIIKKKRSVHRMDRTVWVDYRMKVKEGENLEKY